MKKLLIPFMLLVALVISACGESNGAKEPAKEEDKAPTTITYESENGPIEVPANPKRVVALANAGFVMALDVNIVGVDSWSKANKRYEPYIKDAVEVSDESLEKIIELEPDLILALPTSKNLDKLAEIAPTVTYTYGKVDYLTQHIEIGKLLNKEDEARAWVDDFKARAGKAGEEVRAKIGEDATVSVMENYAKELYVFGDNWGRGTEILYQEMKLKMPEKVKEMALKEGYYALSAEVIPEYAGDYMILSSDGADNSFKETESYKNIPAVKNNRVFEADASEFYFNDPITLDFQLDFFIDSFKNSK
ncbi:iron-hydroxamate ABC transporter substrate-binding protein [Robertmurraya yapensis]|uniref:Iron-hydroxamate ABC transporter substrate-binding protein n=2 Tax=Bacillaceae TaxID=186817 RepID=A0A431VZ04_9BACI|nr:iron-hydroxamate ABC transporter substrate-binding protein [Bacillus yapensis]RTR28434.1 iron-hydroxamate ABC transporter substrate-binding protein [Bacillus yapensis]TKS94495.1 iron-hydroxamate ABC transporter substrate-binding protein [Bacillus yapensis]